MRGGYTGGMKTASTGGGLERRAFGKTGLEVSVLGFGASPAAHLGIDRKRTAALLGALLDRGMNLIDTAASYPGSEEFLGEYFAHRREDYVLVSKCGGSTHGVDSPAWSAAQIAASVEQSLRRIRTDRIDVMLLHTCPLEVLKQGEAMGALVKAREAGKIRFAGFSGDNEAAAFAAGLAEVAVIEMSINIADQRNIDAVLPIARKNGKGIIAKRPVANAAWKKPADQPGMYRGYSATYTQRLAAMKLDPAALGIAGPAELAWPELALRFAISPEGVHTAIAGTTNPENAMANLAALAKGPLAAETVRKVREAFEKTDVKREWMGLT